jgi:hypothetical protein
MKHKYTTNIKFEMVRKFVIDDFINDPNKFKRHDEMKASRVLFHRLLIILLLKLSMSSSSFQLFLHGEYTEQKRRAVGGARRNSKNNVNCAPPALAARTSLCSVHPPL